LGCIGEDEVAFKSKLTMLFQKYPNIDKEAMGFVDDWQELEIWRSHE